MRTNIAAAASVALIISLQLACGSPAEEGGSAGKSGERIEVPTMNVTRGAVDDFYEATGTVQAKTTTQVSSSVMGRITSFPFSEGDTVTRGQVIVQIDNSENKTRFDKANAGLKEARAALIEVDRTAEAAEAAVRTAEANRDLAEKTFGRIRQLHERGSATGQEFDEAQSRFRAANSEVERAKANVAAIRSKKQQIEARIQQAQADIASTRVYTGYTRIEAPVSGVIVKKFAEQGAVATPGQPILSIEDNSRYRLEAAVESSKAAGVRIGQRVNVAIDALGDPEMFGTVSEILPSADPSSRTVTVKIDLPSNAGLRSGLYGLARFPTASREAVTVPSEAVVTRGQLTGVYVLSADRSAIFRIVTTGKTTDGRIEVLSGLSEGETIVSSETGKVSEGAKIK